MTDFATEAIVWIAIHLHTMYVSLLNITLGILNHSHAYILGFRSSLYPYLLASQR